MPRRERLRRSRFIWARAEIFAILPDLRPRFSGAFFSADALCNCVATGRAVRRHYPINK
jgi:hypothetical protein